MNTVEAITTIGPYGNECECSKVTVADVTQELCLTGVAVNGRQHTLSMWVKADVKARIGTNGDAFDVTTEWQKFATTFTAESEDASILFDRASTYFIYNAQLEFGNKASSWTPSPYDVDEEIAAAAAAAAEAQAAANKNAEDMAEAVAEFNKEIDSLQGQIDSSFTSWFYEGEPSSSTEPENGWSDNDKANHVGDLYYDTTTGYCYRYLESEGAYLWERIVDSDVAEALAKAKDAQDTADSKRRVFFDTPAAPYDMGDLWVQGDGGDILRCQTAQGEGGSYSAAHWVLASKYTDDTAADAAAEAAGAAAEAAGAAADAADAAAEAAEAAQKDIDSLSVGGRNLYVVKDQSDGYITSAGGIADATPGVNERTSAFVPVSPGDDMVLQVWVTADVVELDAPVISLIEADKVLSAPTIYLSDGIAVAAEVEDIPSEAWLAYAFYDEGGSVVGSRVERGGGTVVADGKVHIVVNMTVPNGAAYIRACARTYSDGAVKLEKGNRPTDWTPAPEDMASKPEMDAAIRVEADRITSTVAETYSTKEEAADAEERSKDYADGVDSKYSDKWSQVEQLADTISQLVVNTDENGTEFSLMEQTASGWKFNMASIMESIKSNEDASTKLDEKYADEVKKLQDSLEAFGSYVVINAFDDGTPYIELGNSGAFKVRITNEKMAFIHTNGDVEKELTTIDTETMNIASATIGDELRVGGLCISKRGNKNVGFTWKEESGVLAAPLIRLVKEE